MEKTLESMTKEEVVRAAREIPGLKSASGEVVSLARVANDAPQRWAPPEWTSERVALAKKAVTPASATDAEFEFFISWCKRTGLDPFIKQAYLVERRQKLPSGEWASKHEPMASEAGMASIADAQEDFAGVKAATVYAGDSFEVDEDAQKVGHRWNLADRAKAGNKVIGAWAHAQRRGRVVPIVWVPIESRIQTRFDKQSGKQVPTQFWERDPAGMAVKCARAMAYRLAFPNLFSMAYIPEELREEDEGPAPTPPGASTASRTAEVLGKVAKALGDSKPSSPPAPAAKPSPLPEEVLVGGGTFKGQPVSGLEADQLATAIAEHEDAMTKARDPKKRLQIDGWLGALKDEQQKRIDSAGDFA